MQSTLGRLWSEFFSLLFSSALFELVNWIEWCQILSGPIRLRTHTSAKQMFSLLQTTVEVRNRCRCWSVPFWAGNWALASLKLYHRPQSVKRTNQEHSLIENKQLFSFRMIRAETLSFCVENFTAVLRLSEKKRLGNSRNTFSRSFYLVSLSASCYYFLLTCFWPCF